jgi:hypothetical protein
LIVSNPRPLTGFALALFVCLTGCVDRIDPHVRFQEEKRLEADARHALFVQAEAWNRGDWDGYMTGYWNSEYITFSFGGKTAVGWQAAFDRYKAEYPTPDRMGLLTIGELNAGLLDSPWAKSPAAYVRGRWFLSRAPDPVGGNFSLLMRQMADGWRIIHDHRSVDTDARPPEARQLPIPITK